MPLLAMAKSGSWPRTATSGALICWLLIWCLDKNSLANCLEEEGPSLRIRLAPVWGVAQFSKDDILGSFRILSELHVNGLGTFLAEETSLGSFKQFRIDISEIVESAGPADGPRLLPKSFSVLSDGRESKQYFIKPFTCKPFSMDDQKHGLDAHLPREFLDKFPPPQAKDYPFLLLGVGSIWEWALQKLEANPKEASLVRPHDEQGFGHDVAYVSVKPGEGEAGELFAYEIRLFHYYTEDLADRGSLLLRPEILCAVHLVDPNDGQVLLEVRIIQIETSVRAERWLSSQEDLFSLPVGFGCTANEESMAVGEKTRTPKICDLFSADGSQHFCRLEVAVLLPKASEQNSTKIEQNINKWRVQLSSLDLMGSQLLDRHFKAYELHTHSPGGTKSEPKLSKIKTVWQIDDQKPARPQGETFFQLDTSVFRPSELLGACSKFGQASFSSTPSFKFGPLLVPSGGPAKGEAKPPKQIDLAGLVLDEKMFNLLFYDSEQFYQVRQSPFAIWFKRRELVQERRLETLHLFGPASSGEPVWWGPASIVRQFYIRNGESDESNYLASLNQVEIHTMIFLFSPDQTQLLAKIHLRLMPELPIDAAYAHRQLNVGPCLEQLMGAWGPHASEQSSAESLEYSRLDKVDSLQIALEYPIAIDQIKTGGSEISKLDREMFQYEIDELLQNGAHVRDEIYGQFLRNLDQLVNGDRGLGLTLNALQVSDVQVETSTDLISIAATVHKWPQLFNFDKNYGHPTRLSLTDEVRKDAITELKVNAEKCAESCDHLRCLAFEYCSDNGELKCSMVLSRKSRPDSIALKTLESNLSNTCDLYTRKFKNANGLDFRQNISPLQLLNQLKQAVRGQSEASEGIGALQLELNIDENSTIVLKPLSLNLNGKQLLGLSGGLVSENTQDQILDFMEPEYDLIFRDRKFKSQVKLSEEFPLNEVNHVDNVKECEQLCNIHDCRSFSYCQDENTCMLSQLHETKNIEEQSIEKPFCEILARDYLSKFHRLATRSLSKGQLEEWTSSLGQDDSNLEDSKNPKMLELGSDRDCAISCMSATDFTCRSFLFCPNLKDKQQQDCFLLESRLGDFQQADSGETNLEQSESCHYYRRSYLAEFSKHHGMRLEHSKFIQASPLDGYDIEECATKCVEMDESGDDGRLCESFQICLDRDASMKPSATCAIMTASGAKGNTSLVQDDKCTAFVPLKEARFDNEGSLYEVEIIPPPKPSYMPSLIAAISGAIVGYTMGWILVELGYIERSARR